MKNLIIVGVVLLVGFAVYKLTFGRLDMKNPEAVTKAFVAALKKNDLSAASEFWVPAEAEAWLTKAIANVSSMQSGTSLRFFEGLPEGSAVYTVTAVPKQPANEKTLSTEGAVVSVREIDQKWYVCKAPI